MNFRPLRPGDRGPEVADVQLKLRKLGYDVGEFAPDGIFGKLTAKAINDLKKANGLTDDEILDEAAWKVLVEQTYELGGRLLYIKSPNFRGRDVYDLQVKLNQLGFHAGQMDGIFGPNTDHALREFQQDFGIASDGIFGPESLRSFVYLRKVFAVNTGVRFAQKEKPGSVVHALDGKKVFLDLEPWALLEERIANTQIISASGQDPEPGPDPLTAEEAHAFLYDFGLRLANQLEIMNALVAYGPGFDFENMTFHDGMDFELVRRGSEAESEIRLTLGLAAGRDPHVEVRKCFGAVELEARAMYLAGCLADQFERKLGIRLETVRPSHQIRATADEREIETNENAADLTVLPACLTLRALHCVYNIELLREAGEEMRQKIAVAAFDAIKDVYLAESLS